MSDATLSALLREAQRAGRLGTLSPGAAKILGYLAACCSNASARDPGEAFEWWVGHKSSESFGIDWVDPENVSTEGTADDAREVGKFLRELLAVLG